MIVLFVFLLYCVFIVFRSSLSVWLKLMGIVCVLDIVYFDLFVIVRVVRKVFFVV